MVAMAAGVAGGDSGEDGWMDDGSNGRRSRAELLLAA